MTSPPKFCSQCGQSLILGINSCNHCGAVSQSELAQPPSPIYPLSSSVPKSSPSYPLPVQAPKSSSPYSPVKIYKNPGTATVLSFFFTGLGQIYNEEISKGVILIILSIISLFLMGICIGFVTTPILWVWGMVDANKSAKRINEEIAKY